MRNPFKNAHYSYLTHVSNWHVIDVPARREHNVERIRALVDEYSFCSKEAGEFV